MANGYNQYIGMRYVPIVDGEWSQSKAYEPLVVVTYNGNSYISKTYVPAGTLPTNETYWILAANYNAQVEQYRQEVRQYQQVVEGFDADITGIQGDITGIQGDITDIQGDITTINGTLEEKVSFGDIMVVRYRGASEVINANTYGTEVEVDVSREGYTCEGVVGYNAYTTWCLPFVMEVQGDVLHFNFRNFASTQSTVTPVIDLLYFKTRL